MANERLIFVVDDDVMYTQMLEDHLSSDPSNKVRCFSTGEECLSHLHEGPAYIILDYNLNQVSREAKNGLEILEQIRKQDNKVKIVMLSGQERYGVALQTISKGAEQYVVKDKSAFEKISKLIRS